MATVWQRLLTTEDDANYKNDSIEAGDVPAHSTDKLTSGTLPVSRGGTGATFGYNKTNWDTAYGWGNHASGGYSTATGVENNADVTDATNVTAAGALMDSGFASLSDVKAINQGLTTSSVAQFNRLNLVSAENTMVHLNSSDANSNIYMEDSVGGASVNIRQDGNTYSLRTGGSERVSTTSTASTFTGEVRATNEVTAYYGSDIAMKKNLTLISNPLEKVLSLSGYDFKWKAKVLRDRGGEDGYYVREKDVGIIAQEVEKVCPEIVATREDGHKAVKYEKLVPLLIESIKELTAKVTRLEDGNS